MTDLSSASMNIFDQGLLRYLSREQLLKIRSVTLGIGGAGGLGSNAAVMLVRTGFVHFQIIDCDAIEPSNLNRQQYYLNEVGLRKTDVLEKRLLDINPHLELTMSHARWSPENGHQYFHGCDIILEAFDQAEMKHRFVDYYHDKAKYLISGVGMAGLTEKKPMQIKRMGNIFFCGDLSTDSHKGHPPLAPRVSMCAALMAEVVLDLSLGITPRQDAAL